MDRKKIASNRENTKQNFLVVLAFLIMGSFVRLVQVLTLDFPLNDGGLFYSIVEDLGASDQILPAFITYNQEQIPFAYPPLAFYVTRFINGVFGVSVGDVIRLGPAVISVLSIPVFFLVAKNYLETRLEALGALVAYVFLPTAFDWLIVGGGLTRSPAWLFSLGALYYCDQLFRNQKKRDLLLTALLAALTILTHPGVAWFTFYSLGVLFVFRGKKSKKNLLQTSGVVIITGMLSAAWWLPIVLRYGVSIYFRPFQTVDHSISTVLLPFTFLFTNEPFLDILAWAGLIGVVLSLKQKKYHLVAWAATVFILDPRLSHTYVSIPFSMLAGKGFVQGVMPLFQSPRKEGDHAVRIGSAENQFVLGAFNIFLFVYLAFAAFLAPSYHYMNESQTEALRWIEFNTPEEADFVVMTGNPDYGTDYVSEWFPALTRRRSLATPQGAEWLPNQEFLKRIQSHRALQSCARKGISCLESWKAGPGESFAYLYLSKKSLQEEEISAVLLMKGFANSREYNKIFENQTSVIYQAVDVGGSNDGSQPQGRSEVVRGVHGR